jgi:hypothetical protein
MPHCSERASEAVSCWDAMERSSWRNSFSHWRCAAGRGPGREAGWVAVKGGVPAARRTPGAAPTAPAGARPAPPAPA